MLLGNSLVTKDCWEPVFESIQDRFASGDYFKMHGREVYTMHIGKDWLFVGASDDGRNKVTIHGWLLLERYKECWEVGQSFVFPASRGNGWARLIYDAVIRSEGMILASGFKQSKTGRRMWRTLIKSDRYTVWAHDFVNRDVFEPVLYDEETDQIWSSLPLYEKTENYMPWKQDIRLIAIRKSK